MTAARTGTQLSPESPIPEKLYFKIGEVSQLVGVRAHVLRYWEKEISSIRPSKSASNQRRYRRKDVEIFREIRRLLYEERYTLAGARKRLASGGKDTSGAGQADLEAEPTVEDATPTVEEATPTVQVEPPMQFSPEDSEPSEASNVRKPQLDLGFSRAADTERLERVRTVLRELIRMAEE